MQKRSSFGRQLLSAISDSDFDVDPYKIAGFVLIGVFICIIVKVMQMVDAGLDIAAVGLVSSLLLPVTTMITFLFNFSKQTDIAITNGAGRQDV